MNRTATAIAGVALIAVAAGIATGWIWSSETTVTRTVGETIDRVELDGDSGNITITAGDVDQITVKQHFSYRFTEPSDAFDVDDGALKLEDCGWWCSVDYEVVVPRETKVTGKMDSGNLTLAGVAGAEFEADSGTVKLQNIDGPITADLDSGDLEGTGLSGPFTGTIDSGNIDLTFAEAADVTLDVDSGNIELMLPDGPYQVSGETDSGTRDIRVKTDPSALHKLVIEADSGDVLVRSS